VQAVKGSRHEVGGEEGEELHSPGMAAAAIGAVVLFLAATSFRANANTDSNDGKFRCSSRRKLSTLRIERRRISVGGFRLV
jgi:hypothetical protein